MTHHRAHLAWFATLALAVLGLLPMSASPALAQQGATADISFDDIKFDIEKDGKFDRGMLTPEIEALSGDRIRIRGYILPSFQQKGITEFVLVRDNMECCFGPGAALYDCIIVRMEPGKSTEFTTRPVAVEGVFDIEEFRVADRLMAIYRMRGEKVK